MMDDRQRLCTWRDAERVALHPDPGKLAGLLIGPLGDRKTLYADIEAGIVHHCEHAFETTILLTDPPADRVLIGKNAGWRRMDAEFMFQAQGADFVAWARCALAIGQEFGDEKERDPPAAGRRIGGARQHHVDDVWREVVVAVGDKNLLAGDAVMVPCRHRAASQGSKVRPGLWLGQIHRAGPLARDELAEIELLLLRRPMRL